MPFGLEAVGRPISPPTIFLVTCLVLFPFVTLGTNIDSKEVYLNGSAYLRLFTPMPIWGHSAISLRSCKGGEILTQRYNRQQLQLTVSQDNITLSLDTPQKSVQSIILERLLDNRWHTIEFLYQYGNLYMIIDQTPTVIANSTYNTLFLTNQEVKNEAAVLIVGNKYSGCLLHGPGLLFNTTAIHAQGVEFGPCPLAPGPCGEVDIIKPVVIDHCRHDPCMQHGVCLSNPDGYECHCAPRYLGKNCEVDSGPPCLSQPCQHGATCTEDSRGDYQCTCPLNFIGKYCEIEINVHPLCDKNPCMNNGTCRVPLGSKTFECDCSRGFSGNRCEIDLNDCESQPCLNNGRCVDEIGKFSCDCSGTGYGGPLCQDNIDECLMFAPCQNGGICFDTYGSYICDCMAGYGGKNCSEMINHCIMQPCQHGGVCKDMRETFECICPQGYSGLFCEQGPPCPSCPIDSECIGGQCVCKPGSTGLIGHCVPDPTPKSAQSNACSSVCKNGGTCTGTASNYTCICASGFTGLHCDQPSALPFQQQEDCPCMNGGSCIGNQTCLCRSGYEGLRCERFEICSSSNCHEPMECFGGLCICPENTNCALPCMSSPCLNNGTCKNKLNDYECQCPDGWTGKNCDVDIDECSSPAQCGNGICVNSKGSFKCYCEPGYTGLRCDTDVDECLTHPCKNNATCINKINDFECSCLPGYTGKDCGVDIDECNPNPCSQGSTCIDSVANFTCICMPGMTGSLCEIDIDDCEPQPCQHAGRCIDKLDGYVCNCTDTGYTGDNCQENIDECLSNPCENGAKCVDMINDYQCTCFQGYTGKNCEIDIDECESSPCQYNGQCLQRSNLTLYNQPDSVKYHYPAIFSLPFSYENASGYECICVPGITGKNCEININECDSNPCSKFGTCNDGVGTYTCECEQGFEGLQCEREINECDKYRPCEHGTCIDQRNDYICDCDSMYGGKNCSVLLTGCASQPCMHEGTCRPYLVNETDHRFNCTCPHGYQGAICDKITTMSLVTSSLITVVTNRDEGYDINLEFKTTLPNGILAFGNGNTYSYILELVNGRLNLHSSLLNKWEGVFIGSGLNDSKWQRVFVAINSSHLVLSANEEQTIYPINSYEGTNGSHTTFPTTYLGGTIPNLQSYLRHLTHNPSSFVGCMQDVVINGRWVFPNETSDPDVKLVNVEKECPREEQCKKDPCNSNGECKDLWYTFSCTCRRPHLGRTCKFNITAATYGHENTTRTAVIVKTSDSAKRAIRSILDISMFIRTRQAGGQVFYLGSDPNKENSPIGSASDSYISAKLHGGELLVKIKFNGTPEAYTVGGNKLDNGYIHLIQVVRNLTLVQVKLNGTEYFRKTLSSTGQLDAEVLYLGGPAPGLDGYELNLSKEDTDKIYFKGIIQDVQISNGSHTMAVEFYPLNETDLAIPPPFGDVTIDTESVLKGEVTDDLCRQQPCQHGAECQNTWNDIECTCPRGYKGKFCQDIEFCELNKCPGQGVCQNLDDGFECITNMTFQGNEIDPLAFNFNPKEMLMDTVLLKPTIEITYRTKTGGTLLYVQDGETYFEIAAYKDQVTLQWKLSAELPETVRFRKEKATFDWNRIYVRMEDNKLLAGWKGWEESTDPSPPVLNNIDGQAYLKLFSGDNLIYLGGMPPSEANVVTKGPNSGAIFKGCLGEVRVGDILLPYFTHNELYPDGYQNRSLFKLNNTKPDEGCILCFEQDCKNEGHCRNPSEEYACECLPGYEADDCSMNIDECETANCTNGATCVDGIASYTCVCLPGYEGQLCEKEIDECMSMPCHNGGQCTDLIASFSCNCTEDYAGPQCDILKLVTCDNGPCRNGSTCLDGYNSTTGNNFTCVCMPGLQGSLCDIPFCKVEPCKNGFCLSNEPLKAPKCKCAIGYTGKYCEIEINECDSQPCQNNGRCIDGIGSFECNCSGTGFNGNDCENDIDECVMEQITCGGKGICLNTRGSFKCQCPAGSCGPNCDQLDICESETNICQNMGVCIEKCTISASDYFCNCTEEFTGRNCTEQAALQDPSVTDIAIIVVPIVVILLAIGGALLGAFIVMARNKRATRGTYSPSAQEYCNPRLEMDNVLKPPPEERLI